LLELFNFFTGLNNIVSHLADAAILQVFEGAIDDAVKGAEGSTSNNAAFEQALVSHLQNSFG